MISRSLFSFSSRKPLLVCGLLIAVGIDTSAEAAEVCAGFRMPKEHCPAVDLSVCGPKDLKCRAERLMACPSLQAPPSGYEPYQLKIDFPQTEPEVEERPWLKFAPFKAGSLQERADQSRAYLSAVLSYVMEGNREVDWRVEKNEVRDWYYAPWMHFDGANGREPLRGLTRELCSAPGVLHSLQKTPTDSWAVGFYNAPGGYQIGQVWKSWVEAATCPSEPAEPVDIGFPEGTVSFKLLFTTATADQVPFLKEAPGWEAYIFPTPPKPERDFCDAGYVQDVHELRLLQLDIAVKDTRSGNSTGWTFGTFIYMYDDKITDVWERLKPVGLQWGNDPQREQQDLAGLEPSKWWQVPLLEGWINPEVAALFRSEGREWLGLHGRLNGPVDNWKSGCTSCHSAQAVGHKEGDSILERPGEDTLPWHACGTADPKIGEPCEVNSLFTKFFANRRGDVSYEPGYLPLDYSLQLAKSLQFYVDWLNSARVSNTSTGSYTKSDGPYLTGSETGTYQDLQIEVPAPKGANIRR